MIEKLQTLYKIDSQGRLREWTMNVDGNKFYAIKGLVEGKKTQDKPTTATPKNVGRSNETTATAQARFEAQAKWQKKIDSGYAVSEEDAKVKKFFEPMLALSYDDRKNEIVYPVYAQPKLDGIRCIVRQENDEIVGRTRNGKIIECIPHILDSLKGFFMAYPKAILDGELYNHEYKEDFNKITSLVRKQKPVRSAKETDKAFAKKEAKWQESLIESADKIQYWVYDMPKLNDVINEKTLFDFRMTELKDKLITRKDCIVIVETNEVYSEGNLDNLYGQYLEQGYEGQMIRNDVGYDANKRSKNLLKRKDFMDAEYKVIDIDEGNGNRSGTAKHLVCYCDKTKQQFNSNIKGSFDYLKEIYDNRKEYIGKFATIKFFQLTPDGIPRFPYAIAFRDYE
tara:strand:- start:688 stop:1875 length:1188 start_codon:yes stop_codon:yes gene_type:complete